MSSVWALGQTVVLGLGAEGQTVHNLAVRPDLVLSLPGPAQWPAVERLAPLTGRPPTPGDGPEPPRRPGTQRYEPAKFEAAGLRPEPAELVRPPKVAGCPLQLEARASGVRTATAGGFVIVEAQVLRVHADPRIVVPGTQHVDPGTWSPLIYNFRHYFGLGPELGRSYRSQTG
jgi:flavin reductase (DIM6/NTAB) family NADH-FMN oxidoreductase RutF